MHYLHNHRLVLHCLSEAHLLHRSGKQRVGVKGHKPVVKLQLASALILPIDMHSTIPALLDNVAYLVRSFLEQPSLLIQAHCKVVGANRRQTPANTCMCSRISNKGFWHGRTF